MFEVIMSSLEDNILWVSACIFVVVVTKITMDILARRSRRRVLKNAERLEAQKEAELMRRIEQASRRIAAVPTEDAAPVHNALRGGVLIHSVPSTSQGRYYFEI